MNNSRDKLRWMESLSLNNTVIHRIKPLHHFIVTLVFILTVVSFNKYSVSQMLPLFLYPAVMVVMGEIPVIFILRTILPAMVLILLLGAANPFLDTRDWILLPGFTINAGWVSAAALILRGLLTLTATLLFMAVAGMQGLISALEKLKVPDFFVTLLAFTFRYMHVLQDEGGSIIRAYRLRAPGQKGIAMNSWGSMGGQWFIRSCKRAERIHTAMACRGLSEKIYQKRPEKTNYLDFVWISAWIVYFLLCRFLNLPQLLGDLSTGIIL